MRSLKVFVLLAAVLAVASCGDGTPAPDGGGDIGEAGASVCASCTANEICVAGYDGTCTVLGVRCQPRTAACASATCSPECNRYLCGGGGDGGVSLSCATTHCTGKTPVAGAFGCYGP